MRRTFRDSVVKYLGKTVVEAARERMAQLYLQHDNVAVMYSGGKDSLVCLELAREAATAAGRLPVDVVHVDEEFVPQSTVDFVASLRQQPWARLFWFCIRLREDRMVMGRATPYVIWGKGREHVRPMPPFAIVNEPGDEAVRLQAQLPLYIKQRCGFKGATCLVFGIRAQESLVRLNVIFRSATGPWLSKVKDRGGLTIGRPVYDWQEEDVFKFLHDGGAPWCSTYDRQGLVPGTRLRLSSALHQTAAAYHLPTIAATEPELAQRILAIFPDTAAQMRYGPDYDQDRAMQPYLADGYQGLERFLRERISEGPDLRDALTALETHRRRAATNPAGYPIAHYARTLSFGLYAAPVYPKRQKRKAAHA